MRETNTTYCLQTDFLRYAKIDLSSRGSSMQYFFRIIAILGIIFLYFGLLPDCFAQTQTGQNTNGDNAKITKLTNKPTEKSATAAPLIPRHILFGNPEKTGVTLSPEGSRIAYLAPVHNVLNVWVAKIGEINQARPVTLEKKRDVGGYWWSTDGDYILYMQDKNGDENFHLYAVNLVSGAIRDLTPFPKIQAQVIKTSLRHTNKILVGLNNRKPEWHDVYLLNIGTGKLTLVEENNQFVGYVADEDLNLRVAEKPTNDGGMEVYVKNKAGKWQLYEKVPFEDALTTHFLGFDDSNVLAYRIDSQHRDKTALYEYNTDTGKKRLLASSTLSDIQNVLFHPTELAPQAVEYYYDKPVWQNLDQHLKEDIEYLRQNIFGHFVIADRTMADDKWLIQVYSDTRPSRFYLYERNPHTGKHLKLTFLFTTYKDLDKQSLAPMHFVKIKSRDGWSLVSYLTLPISLENNHKNSDNSTVGYIPSKPLPMVLLVHGGPWARDYWGLNRTAQWLANRGYAVLEVNYRGSTGFGKKFINAGNKEWAGKMHDDLIDAVNWAITEKIADPKKIAIMGGSYGGYAALVGLTFTPDIFACGVSIVGPSNLVTLLQSIPPYWRPMQVQFDERVGSIKNEKGKKFLLQRSPISYVDRINKPLLLLQGEHDPRVKKNEAEQIVASMKEKSIPVTYVLYHDEGHGFVRAANEISSKAIIEQFLAENLGGLAEPIGNDFSGADFSIVVDTTHGSS